ncbi:MAG: hypothetical protein QOG62_1288 [Thermoleophilaceae bacterium]|jgi:ABC-type dipeptide/oligopeptide/nickel transport system permease subunit|nr:hypothetical protein [Thermoleophilaceae bacterium]
MTNKEEEKEIERKAGRAMIFIGIGAVLVIVLLFVLFGDALRDALS